MSPISASGFEWEVARVRSSLWRRLSAPQLFVGSFLLLVALGTLGLKLLPGIYTGAELSWVDALFTATSAVCVTGLVVVDTATYFTPLGQGFVLLLIQLGGLGIIAFTTLLILLLGRRLSLRQEAFTASSLDVAPHIDYQHLARDLVRFTFAIEALGALVLYLLWVPRFGWTDSLWPAVFHAVSAFCNAGFSTFTTSLVDFQRDPATLLVIAALVVLGGIGFLTLEEYSLLARARARGGRFRVSLHSRLVVATTAALLVAGWAAFALFEWRATLARLPAADRVVNALVLSVMPRTAGFNTIDYALATDSTNFLTILLMFVGGSPGSIAGGIKTTTVALLGLLAWTRFRGAEVVSLWGRSIPQETIQRAVGLMVVAFTVVTTGIFVLTFTETMSAAQPGGGSFLAHTFETVSAFGTVGLSMGVTTGLSTAGKWVVTLLMFVGRVGPLTFAAAIALPTTSARGSFRYAYEDVVIG